MKVLKKNKYLFILFALIAIHSTKPAPPARTAFTILTADEYSGNYKRSEWRHWIDADRDCQNARNEVLIRDSLKPVTYKTGRKCAVASGKWKCPYTGLVFSNPRKLDIDHVVPLKEAYESGGYAWSASKRKAYANDLEGSTLLATQAGANRSKGAKDLSEWLPHKNQCSYLKIWLSIKQRYELTADQREIAEANKLAKQCGIGIKAKKAKSPPKAAKAKL